MFIQPSQPKGKQGQPQAKQAEVAFSDLQEAIRGQTKINRSARRWRNESPEDVGISEIVLTMRVRENNCSLLLVHIEQTVSGLKIFSVVTCLRIILCYFPDFISGF